MQKGYPTEGRISGETQTLKSPKKSRVYGYFCDGRKSGLETMSPYIPLADLKLKSGPPASASQILDL